MINNEDTPSPQPDSYLRPGMQFLIFGAVFIGIFILGNLVAGGLVWVIFGAKTFDAIAVLNVNAPHFSQAIWMLQIVSTTIPIFLSPVVFSYAFTRNRELYLKTSGKFNLSMVVLVFLVMFLSSPLIELLSILNSNIPLPKWMSWMAETEKNDEKLMGAMLQMKTVWGLIGNVLAIGLLTAIAEEFMFRGVLQTIFVKWTKNTHVAVWITAILFSVFHMEFFGLLPRLLLGVLMGYFVAWSGSIWMGVWAHFINNGTIVVVTYLFQKKLIDIDPDNQHLFNYAGYVFSFGVTLMLLILYRKIASSKNKILVYDGEKLG